MIKIIFFDIDGTCYYNKKHEVIESTKLAFKKLKEQGFKIAICTSRSYYEMVKLPKDLLEVMDGIICCAGGDIYEKGIKIKSNIIDNKECVKVVKYFDENNMTYRWISDDGQCFLNKNQPDTDAIFDKLYQMVPGSKKYNGEALTHILYYTHENQVKKDVIAIMNTSTHIDLGYANEIIAHNINKGYGITYLANHFGFDISETAAFGDGYNDVPMIQAAKVGVAMGNGCNEVKNVADYVTDNIEDDGVYNACIKYGWIN